MQNRLLALKASAGSGKTFNLVVRYISLCLSGAKPNDILALTFTNKAVNEMKERILSVALNLAQKEEYLNEIIKATNLTKDEILNQNIEKSFLESEIQISTIDGFFNQILKLFCWYAGVDRGYEIKNDKKEYIEIEFLQSLNDRLFDDFVDLALLVGGNFDTLFTLFYQLNSKEFEFEFKNLTKVNKNSLILLQDSIFGEFKTIKEYFFQKNISDSCKKAFYKIETIEDIIDSTWIKKESFSDYLYTKKKEFNPKACDTHLHNIKELLKEYFKARETLILIKLKSLFEAFQKSRIEYKNQKKELTFDDITKKVSQLLSRIENNFLYFRLDSKVNHILIDEFQDTSLIQYKILKPIIEEICQNENRSFFYVGDTKQSIYRFRGGYSELFDFVKERHDVTLEHLNINYRSEKNIVDFVNSVFLQNGIKNQIDYEIQESKSNEALGYVDVIKTDDILKNILDAILLLKSKNINLDDIAILSFKNRDLQKIQEFLNANDIETITDSSTLLIEQPLAKAIINLIKYYYFKQDDNKNIELYRANYLAIVGQNPFESNINFKIDVLESPSKVIKKISDEAKLFDESVLELINLSLKFSSLTEFIYEIDYVDSTISFDRGVSGVRLMTIHKSKGLGFEHLIVVDRENDRGNDNSKFLFTKERDIKVKFSNREFFDDEYNQILQENRANNQIDLLNQLYVAFTRAKKSLIVITKEKSQTFDLLRLESKKIGEILYSQSKVIDKKAKSIPIDIENFGTQSDIVHEEREYKPNNIESIIKGKATHFMLENLSKFDLDSLKIAKEKCKNEYGHYIDIDLIYQSVKNLIENPKFQELINGKISREIPIIYNQKLYRIDLMIQKDDEILIIDYKTSNSEYAINNQNYKKQVKNYVEAIKNIKNIDNIKGYLCLILEDSNQILEV